MSTKGILGNLQRCARKRQRFDSDWERQYMLALDSDPLVKRWQRAGKLHIPYQKPGGRRGRYFPDFFVERVDGVIEIHEVKGTYLANQPETQAKFRAAEEFCRRRGMQFKVITKQS